MTPVAFTLPETASIGEAARIMLADNAHAAPVVSPDNRVIGMLSATDIHGVGGRRVRPGGAGRADSSDRLQRNAGSGVGPS